jgi:putative NIF3 family GTP cyclohydrolase 1 type 2
VRVTVSDVIGLLTDRIGPIEETVDKLLLGGLEQEVKGIAVAFMPTIEAIEQAAAMGANLIIAHEGANYSHHSGFDEALANDPVYQDKLRLLRDKGINLYRCHDYPHREQPDLITMGLIEALGWQDDVTRHSPTAALLTIPPMTLGDLIERVKTNLAIPSVRAAGNLALSCSRIGITVGYRGGGGTVIPLLHEEDVDLIICGEGQEWEAPEYVRDAAHRGMPKALIAIGHAESEQPGMRKLAERLQQQLPEMPVAFIPNDPVFRTL